MGRPHANPESCGGFREDQLKRVQLPEANKRSRVASADELDSLQALGDQETWRIVQVALHTGLREAKILEIERSWMKLKDDGWWLLLPPARSALKGTPTELPLNRVAVAALKSDVACIDGAIFHNRTSEEKENKTLRSVLHRLSVIHGQEKPQDLSLHDEIGHHSRSL